MIAASVVADSISPAGKRLATLKLRYPKFIHGELMTHRVFSRNASSSRAVPTAKLIEEVESPTLRAQFVHWGRDQKGMGTTEELTGAALHAVYLAWQRAAYYAADQAKEMLRHGASKQLVNRLLEPFSHINVVVSATEWENFFRLRLAPDAQPEMRALAVAMKKALNASMPKVLAPGEWHAPFVDVEIDGNSPSEEGETDTIHNHHHQYGTLIDELIRKVSAARCARVSYESFETGRRSTVSEDLRLATRLLASKHMSPFEHQATPDELATNLIPRTGRWRRLELHGNFVVWVQHRKTIEGESGI